MLLLHQLRHLHAEWRCMPGAAQLFSKPVLKVVSIKVSLDPNRIHPPIYSFRNLHPRSAFRVRFLTFRLQRSRLKFLTAPYRDEGIAAKMDLSFRVAKQLIRALSSARGTDCLCPSRNPARAPRHFQVPSWLRPTTDTPQLQSLQRLSDEILPPLPSVP